MILTKVLLKNFKKHTSLEVELTEGLNTIAGPNYSGKSTIQQAILYALYGPAGVPGNGDGIPTKGAKGKPEVTLDFIDDDAHYQLVRSGSNATLLKGVEVISRSASAVVKEIEKLSGLTKDQLLKTRVSKQGDAHALLSTGTQELKRLVETLSGCQVVDKIGKKAAAELKTSTDKIGALSEAIDMTIDLKSLKVALEDLGVSNSKYLELKNKYETVKSTRRAELRAADAALTKARTEHQTYCDAFGEKVSVEAQLEALFDEFTALRSDPALMPEDKVKLTTKSVTDLEALTSTAKANRLARAKLTESLASLQAREVKCTKTVEVNEANQEGVPVPEGEITRLAENVQEASETLVLYKNQLKQAKELIAGGVCGTCNRPMDDMSPDQLEAHRVEAGKFEVLVESAVQAVNAAKKERKQKSKDLADFNAWNLDTVNAKARLTTVQEQIELVTGELNDFPVEDTTDHTPAIRELRKALYGVEVAERLLKANVRKSADAQNKLLLITLPKEVDIKFFEHAHNKANVVHQNAVEDLFTLMDEYTYVTGRLLKAETEYKHYVDVHTKIAELNTAGSGYKAIVKVVKDNRSTMMMGIWDGLLEEAGNFVSACTSGDVTALNVDEKFNLTYTEGEYDFPIDSASGAQKSLIGLGLRLAIANMLPSNVGFLMLDEITADMTNNISAIAMSVLRTKCDQALAISHREQDISTSDNVISLGE